MRRVPGPADGRAVVPDDVRRHIQDDPWARTLGVEFLELGQGYCRVALVVQPHMVNFQGYPHGGVVFSLADIAFGAACNTHGQPAVALTVTISYLAAVTPGARLVAEGQERKQGRRAGFYDVTVTSGDGTVVAAAHCVAHRVTVPDGAPASPGNPGGVSGASRAPSPPGVSASSPPRRPRPATGKRP